jgi:inner membrane protein
MSIENYIQSKHSLFFKLIAISFMIGISVVASFMVYGLTNERAHWADIARAPENPDTTEEHMNSFSGSLNEETGFYRQIMRSIKYAILFIILTFLAFFMFEVLAGLRIHPLNYLLIGLAIALFYLLLLSFAELIGFPRAYTISAGATTTLITVYSRSVLKAEKRAGIIASILTVLYSYLYVLLQLDEFSLVLGSIFLFIILATTMYLTRNIDWYTFSEQTTDH